MLAFDAQQRRAAVGEAIRVARRIRCTRTTATRPARRPSMRSSCTSLWLDGDKVTLAALTHDGDEVWRREVGSLVEKHGFGTSPVVVGDVVCVANETRRRATASWSASIARAATCGGGAARHRQDVVRDAVRAGSRRGREAARDGEHGLGRDGLRSVDRRDRLAGAGERSAATAASARRSSAAGWCSSRAARATTACI